jgi:hypothetical protein
MKCTDKCVYICDLNTTGFTSVADDDHSGPRGGILHSILKYQDIDMATIRIRSRNRLELHLSKAAKRANGSENGNGNLAKGWEKQFEVPTPPGPRCL